ncbi:hypothetical protein JB92DRAFT_639200 [Gautieria morchelliformis]|nr:hypothetical protein JB92DRAFT_639200 [Gautieria morchelliformis]
MGLLCVHTREHGNMGVTIRDFAIDPAQDLVVLSAESETLAVPAGRLREYPIHLRAMSSGGNHPNASDPILSCIPVTIPSMLTIQVIGDFLAFLFRSFLGDSSGEPFIWNWKTGRHLKPSVFR